MPPKVPQTLLHLHHAGANEAPWLLDVLNREGKPLRTRARQRAI